MPLIPQNSPGPYPGLFVALALARFAPFTRATRSFVLPPKGGQVNGGTVRAYI